MREGARGDGVEGGEERMVVCVDGRGEEMVVGSQGKSRHCCWWCQREREREEEEANKSEIEEEEEEEEEGERRTRQ